MGKVKTSLSMSLDGFIAGPKDDHSTGRELAGLDRLHAWSFPPKQNSRESEAETFRNVGAVIMGRRMFDLGEKPWGANPAFHLPVFVLTHRSRSKLIKEGGTTFIFVTEGIKSALQHAKAAAGDKDVIVMGGANTVQQYLKAGLLDEMHLHLVPVLLGEGIRLFEDPGTGPMQLEKINVIEAPEVTHLSFRVVNQ